MSADSIPVTPLNPARHDRIFHTGMGIAFLITAFVGFGPTYFFKPVHPSPPFLLSGPGRAAFGNSAAWQSFARFLVG